MSKKHKINFQVFSETQYDKIVEELLQITSDWKPEQISKLVSKKFSLTLIPGQPLMKNVVQSFPFYRIRIWNVSQDPIDENDPKEFSYPPDKSKIKLGRANLAGMQVLYGSGDPHTPFHELKKDIFPEKSVIYMSKWGIKPEAENAIMRNLFLGIPFDDRESYAAIMARAIDEGVKEHLKKWPSDIKEKFLYGQKKYNELFCAEGELYYHVTSAMVHEHFNSDSKNGISIPIVTYPSVAKNRDSVNFAIKKEFVDKFMYIKEVQKIVVKEIKDETINATLLSKGTVVDGKFNWQTIHAKLDNVDYKNAKVVFNSDAKAATDLKDEDRITTCCKDHGMTIQQFFEKCNITEQKIIQGFSNTDLGSFEGDFPVTVQRGIIAPTKGNVYLTSQISDDKKISHFLVPFTYTIDFH